MILLLTIFLVGLTGSASGAPCGVCDQSKCPSTTLDNCTSLVSDECNCCRVCLRSVEETCGEGIGLCHGELSCVQGICKDEEGRPDCSTVQCPQDTFNCAWDSVYVPGAPSNLTDSCCQTPGECVCDTSKCTKVVCPEHYVKRLQSAGKGQPGQCCDMYQCEPDVKDPDSEVCVDPVTGVRYASYYDQSPCVRCTCYSGASYCQNTTCPRLLCANPVHHEDECCPRCETGGCSPDFKCSLDCPYGLSTDNKGCRVCECRDQNQDCPAITEDCDLTCEHKYALDSRGCEVCKCHECDTNKHCTLDCGYGFELDWRGCPLCNCKRDAEGNTLRPEQRRCFDSGTLYNDKDSWKRNGCQTCICRSGVIDCGPVIDCDHLSCLNTYTKAGECCPICVEECVDVNGQLQAEGQVWETGCKTCTCTNGSVSCHEKICPELQCTQAVYIPGKCCSVCSAVIDNEISEQELDYTIALISEQGPHTIKDRQGSLVDHLSASIDHLGLTFSLRLYFSTNLRDVKPKLSGTGSVVLVSVMGGAAGVTADKVIVELRQAGLLQKNEPDLVDYMTYREYLELSKPSNVTGKQRSKVSTGLIVGAVIISCIVAVGIIFFGARRYMVLSNRRKFKHTATMGQSADHLIHAVDNSNVHRLTINFGAPRITSDQSADSTFSASPTPSDLVSPSSGYVAGHDNLASSYNPLSQVAE